MTMVKQKNDIRQFIISVIIQLPLPKILQYVKWFSERSQKFQLHCLIRRHFLPHSFVYSNAPKILCRYALICKILWLGTWCFICTILFLFGKSVDRF